MRYSEQSECVKSSIRLKQQEEVIEKTLDNFVSGMKLEPEILRVLLNERNSYALDRRKLSNSLRVTMLEITNELTGIKSEINGLQEGRKIDVDSFKRRLMSLASKMREFKKNCSSEELTREEIELDEYLHAFSLSLNKYEARNSSAGSLIVPRESSKKKCNSCEDFQEYKDVRDFDALVAKTGHTQNWSEEDHLLFLKVRKTSHNVPAIVATMRKKCPDLSAERIVNHEAWYKVYLDLREKQRKTIRDWRSKKELEKRQKVESTKALRDDDKSCDAKVKTSTHESFTKESGTPENSSKTSVKNAKDSSANHQKEILTRWRMNKESTRALEDEHIKSELESRRISKENRRLARARQIKAAVSAYREKKMENLTSSSATSPTDSDRMIAKSEGMKLIKSFRRQDEEFLQRRKALLASKKSNSSILVRHKMQARSDRQSTLLKPTKGWLEKCKQNESHSEQHQQVLFVKDIPKLATRNWRNRESS